MSASQPPPSPPGGTSTEPAPPAAWRARRANPTGEVMRLQFAVGALVVATLGGLYVWQARRTAAFEARLANAAVALARMDEPGLRAAEALTREALARRPGNDLARARLALILALLWQEVGDPTVAAEAQERGSALERDGVGGLEAHVALAVLARASGRSAEASRRLDEALAAAPHPPWMAALKLRWQTVGPP
jgi:tetratricopeptide (TPR) repeat protein